MFDAFPFVTFTDVTIEDFAFLKSMSYGTEFSLSTKKSYLSKCMKVEDGFGGEPGSFTHEIVSDLYMHTWNFGERQGFTERGGGEKMSTLLSIVKLIFTQSMELALSSGESYELFKHAMLKHSCQRPPFSTGVFDREEVETVSDYVLDTFFRHYKMYRYVFVCVRDLEVHLKLVEPCKLDSSVTTFKLQTLNERDPREEPFFDHIFEEERKQDMLRQQEEANRLARLAKLTFEERVIGQVARLERDVDEAIRNASPVKEA